MCAALPHLTPEPEARYRELTPHARQWPPRPLTGQYRLQTAHFAAFWNIMIHYALRLFRRIPPQFLLNVKFEEVQSDPEPQIKRIIRFISPALEDHDWRQDACAVPRPTVSRFQQPPPQEQTRIAEACRPDLMRLGYPP